MNSRKAPKPATANLAEVVEDYNLFIPAEYLTEYHLSWDEEDEFSSQFLHTAFESIAQQHSMIDIGGGPTIYQLISARNKVDTITCAEFLEANRREVEKWKINSPDAFNWDEHFKHYLALEKRAYCQSIEEMKACLRSRLTEFAFCDVRNDPPVPGSSRTFDVVTSHFLVEHISKSDSELETRFKTIISLLRPGGYLIMSFLKNSDIYKVGNLAFYTYRVNEQKCKAILLEIGCRVLQLETGPAPRNWHYQGTFSLLAQRL